MTPDRWLVVADDLTGCLDTTVAFVRRRCAARVTLYPRPLTLVSPSPLCLGVSVAESPLRVLSASPRLRGEVPATVGIDTETRDLQEDEAAQRVYTVIRAAQSAGVQRIYKKIDSILRGPLEAEIDAAREAVNGPTLICPAVPSAGRTFVNGVQHVDGKPLPDGDLRQRLGEAALVPITIVRRGPPEILRALERAGDCPLILADATRDRHLENIAMAVRRWARARLFVGAAGLAHALAEQEFRGKAPRAKRSRPSLPLIVSASRHPVTQRQVARLEASGMGKLCAVNAGDLQGRSPAAESARVSASALRSGQVPMLFVSSAGSESGPCDEDPSLAHALGRLAAEIVRENGFPPVILSGGDTAFGLLRALEVGELELEGLSLPNMPVARVLEGTARGLQVITKSGGFGQEDALVRLVEWLRGDRNTP